MKGADKGNYLCLTETETPRVEVELNTTGEGLNGKRGWKPSKSIHDTSWSKPREGSHDADNFQPNSCMNGQTKIKTRKQKLRIGTWNVRSLIGVGKLALMESELQRLKVDVAGIAETRWEGEGHFITTKGNTIVYSGGKKSGQKGVAFFIRRELSASIIGYKTISERILSIKMAGSPIKINILQVYAPTSEAEEDEIQEFYNQINEEILHIPKKEIIIICGDFNAKIGSDGTKSKYVGTWGMGNRNERGQLLVDFCEENGMVIQNTFFQQHPRRIYTWTSPNGQTKNQIDYVLTNDRWRRIVKNCKTYPGADVNSDHQLLVAVIKIRLKKLKKPQQPIKYNLEKDTDEYTMEVQNRFEILQKVQEEKTPDELWEDIKHIIKDTAAEHLQKKQKSRNKEWITSDTWKLVTEKRRLKNATTPGEQQQYKKLKQEVQKNLRRDKNQQINSICTELEEQAKRGNSRGTYEKLNELTRKFAPKMHCIRAKNGLMLSDKKMIADRWKEYGNELFDGEIEYKSMEEINSHPNNNKQNFEPPPLRSEVEEAMRKTRNRKATGIDDVPIELLKLGQEEAVNIIHKLCCKIWQTGEWPNDWLKSVFIPIPKKGDRKECTNYRTIALITHTSKVMLRIILNRMDKKMEDEVAEEQAGFRKGRGTRDQITNLRIIMEKAKEYQQPLYMCFVDYTKAFDSIPHEKLWYVMLDMGFPAHLVHLLMNLYKNQKGAIKINDIITDWFRIRKGARQGCILSPFLFNIISEMIMRNALYGFKGGVKLGGKTISNLRYADDIVLIATSEEELKQLVERISLESKKYGLHVNEAKTKVMTTNGEKIKIIVNGKNLEQVDKFTYLGAIISSDGNIEEEINSRLGKGREVMRRLKTVWKSNNISMKNKRRLMECMAWSVATYGCESWTIKKKIRQRLDAFEMFSLRTMQRISWTEKQTNEEVMKRANTKRKFFHICQKRKLSYFGHIQRNINDNLQQTIQQGIMPGKRKRGRPNRRWVDDLEEWTGMTITTATKTSKERTTWKCLIRDVTLSSNTEGKRK